MTQKGQVYRCNICGNVVSVLQKGDGDLVCCGEKMELLKPEEAKKFA
jgi:superoxide reductase